MLMVNNLIGFGVSSGGNDLLSIINNAGLGSGLKLCLDSGSSDSYPGSGQSWVDLSSTVTNFNLGSSSGSEGSDPTFNGTPGSLTSNEYWSFDGGDFFSIAGSNPSWVDGIHKDNAKYGMIFAIYIPNTAAFQYISATNGGSTANVGFEFAFDNNEKMYFRVTGGGVTVLAGTQPDSATTTGSWHIIGISVDETAGSGFFYEDGAYKVVGGSNTFSATYSSPSSSGATYGMQLGAHGNSAQALGNGARLACVASWEGYAPTKGNLDAVYSVLKTRFGL